MSRVPSCQTVTAPGPRMGIRDLRLVRVIRAPCQSSRPRGNCDAVKILQRFHPANTRAPSVAPTDQFSVMSPPSEPLQFVPEEDSPFNAITEDLRNRIIDWKGHPLSDLGPLQMCDLLSVRRESFVCEFFVYLFKEAIICVVEEKKRSLGRLLSNASGFSDNGSVGNNSLASQSKGVLRLKGRIYVRHIRQVKATSAAGEMNLTIDMEDELASFILIFKDRASLESWKNQIQSQVRMFQAQNPQPQPREAPLDMEECGGSAKAACTLSGTTITTASTVDKPVEWLLQVYFFVSDFSSLRDHVSSGPQIVDFGRRRRIKRLRFTNGPCYTTHVFGAPQLPRTVAPFPSRSNFGHLDTSSLCCCEHSGAQASCHQGIARLHPCFYGCQGQAQSGDIRS
jgi:Pleckstrin homology domain